jgi:hypothetical protein
LVFHNLTLKRPPVEWTLIVDLGPYGPQLDKTERMHEVRIWIYAIYGGFEGGINKETKRETTVFEL